MEKDELIEKCSALISSLDNIKWEPIDFPRKNENSYGHHDLILDGSSMHHQLKMARELLYEAILAIEKQPNLDNIVAHKITEEPCKIYNPQGNLICDCDNELTFLDILCQIKKVQCEGYYVIKNDLKYKINADGTVDTKAKPQLFTKYEKYLKELMDF